MKLFGIYRLYLKVVDIQVLVCLMMKHFPFPVKDCYRKEVASNTVYPNNMLYIHSQVEVEAKSDSVLM